MDKINEIKRILGGVLPQLKKEYHIKTIGIFGSYIRGENRKGSDLDILVEFQHLKVADYIVKGVAIERKTVSDFIFYVLFRQVLQFLKSREHCTTSRFRLRFF